MGTFDNDGERPDIVLETFKEFLASKGEQALIWANYKDWVVMPNNKRKEIMTTFANTKVLDVTTTRSFPHCWTFTGMDDRRKEIVIKWTGPSESFYK